MNLDVGGYDDGLNWVREGIRAALHQTAEDNKNSEFQSLSFSPLDNISPDGELEIFEEKYFNLEPVKSGEQIDPNLYCIVKEPFILGYKEEIQLDIRTLPEAWKSVVTKISLCNLGPVPNTEYIDIRMNIKTKTDDLHLGLWIDEGFTLALAELEDNPALTLINFFQVIAVDEDSTLLIGPVTPEKP